MVVNISYIHLYYLSPSIKFEVISFMTKFFQGLSCGSIQLLGFSLASEFSEDSEKPSSISLMEVATSVGLIIGPLLTFFFISVGYIYPFLINILFSLLATILIRQRLLKIEKVYYKKKLKILQEVKCFTKYHYNTETSSSDEDLELIETVEKNWSNDNIMALTPNNTNFVNRSHSNPNYVSENMSLIPEFKESKSSFHHNPFNFLKLIAHKSVLGIFLIVVCDMITQCFFYPVFTAHFTHKFNFSIEDSSLLLSMTFAVYTFGLRLTVYFISRLSGKYVLCLGGILNSISVLLFNPAYFLPQLLSVSILGFIMLNLTAGITVVSSITEFGLALENEEEIPAEFVSDTASGLYILAINIGELLGPTIGGYYTGKYSFETACFVVGLLNLFFSASYFLFFGYEIFKSLLIDCNDIDSPSD